MSGLSEDASYTSTEKLDLFVDRVEELLATQAVRTGAFSIQLSWKFVRNGPMTTMSREPSDELLRSFLLTFRQFVSDKEPVFVNTIANICSQELRSDALKQRVAEARRQWLEACRAGPLRVVIDQDHLSPSEAMDLWINGKYFHNDKRKARRLETLDPLDRLLVRHVFLNHIITATDYVVALANVIIFARRQSLLD